MPGHALVLVDLQERLFAAMDAEGRDEVIANVKILVAAARRLASPSSSRSSIPRASATRCRLRAAHGSRSRHIGVRRGRRRGRDLLAQAREP